ncbi:MAG: hypothetical protein IT548_12155 [Alphaproteobacteria bacterium]|nr:hypothetical protein [Alphaproteobacteria bacterium]
MLIAAGTALKVGGDAINQNWQQRWEEKMERLRQKYRADERAEDRAYQDKVRGEEQFEALGREARQMTRDRERDAVTDARAASKERSEERRHQDTLKSEALGSAKDYLELIERDDGTLATLDKRTSKITPVMDGDQPVRGKKANAVPMPREGLSASDDRYMEALERQEGYDARRRYNPQDRDAIFGRIAAKARAAGRDDIAKYYDPLQASPKSPAAAPPPPVAPEAARAQQPPAPDTTPPAPRDPAQREVGQRYRAPDGRMVKWTGRGWEPVQQ